MVKVSSSSISSIKTFAYLFIIVVFGNYIIAAQQHPITGKWSADTAISAEGKLKITLEPENMRSAKRGDSIFINRKDNGEPNITTGGKNSITFERNEVRGISDNPNGPVRFSATREPGTFELEGTFIEGKGSGTFRFLPNYSYIDAMRSRGFEVVGRSSSGEQNIEESLYVAALFNITTSLADGLLAANLGELKYEDLFKAAIFEIDGQFAMNMKTAGLPDINMDQLTKARIFKIQPEDVSGILNAGLGINSFDDLVKYKIFKITPQYLNDLRAEGLTDLNIEDIVKLSIFKIDAAYIREARSEDPNISISKIINKKLGVRVN